MTDEREDRFDEVLRRAAQDYNAPPVTPKAEMWERISAARKADRRTDGQTDGVVPLHPLVRPSARPTFRLAMGIAALLVLGVAIGRFTAPTTLTAPAATVATGADSLRAPVTLDRGKVAARLVTTDHLTRVETFLTEFGTMPASPEFSDVARDLLGTTRLLLDSKRVSDVRTRTLLEDLELVLTQIATLNPQERREDLNAITDGLAQNQLRTRLRNAIPSGPAIRL